MQDKLRIFLSLVRDIPLGLSRGPDRSPGNSKLINHF